VRETEKVRPQGTYLLPVLAVIVLLLPGCGTKTVQDHFREGEQQVAAGKLDEAIASYEAGLELEPGSAAGHNLLGMAYRLKYNALRSSEWKEKEIVAFERAEAADSTFWPAFINLGATLYYMGNPEGAASHFERALALYPQNPERAQLEAMIREGAGTVPPADTGGTTPDSLEAPPE
jgi:tetratricopeptide (TPR) repeat protein